MGTATKNKKMVDLGEKTKLVWQRAPSFCDIEFVKKVHDHAEKNGVLSPDDDIFVDFIDWTHAMVYLPMYIEWLNTNKQAIQESKAVAKTITWQYLDAMFKHNKNYMQIKIVVNMKYKSFPWIEPDKGVKQMNFTELVMHWVERFQFCEILLPHIGTDEVDEGVSIHHLKTFIQFNCLCNSKDIKIVDIFGDREDLLKTIKKYCEYYTDPPSNTESGKVKNVTRKMANEIADESLSEAMECFKRQENDILEVFYTGKNH